MAAIRYQDVRPVPRGEFRLSDANVRSLLGCGEQVSFDLRVAAAELLGVDLWSVDLSARGTSEIELRREIELWARTGRYFVFGQIDGPFGFCLGELGWERFMRAVYLGDARIRELACHHSDRMLGVLNGFGDSGLDGVLICDDIAYDRGTLVSPLSLRDVFFPPLAELVGKCRARGWPVLFHSDGDISQVINDLADLGVNGIHSCQPAAGMNLAELKRQWAGRLCFMGGLELADVLGAASVEEIEAAVFAVLRQGAPGGGYIFGTAGGLFPDGTERWRILAAYGAVRKYDQGRAK